MPLLLTPGRWGDAPQTVEVLDRIGVPKRAYVFHGAVTAAATRLWIRQ
jgi:hypothetical protein